MQRFKISLYDVVCSQPFNGSGGYNRPLGTTTWQNDQAAGVKIKADLHDNHDNDLASALSNMICKDGQTSLTVDIPWGGKKITNLGQGVNPTDAVNKSQLDGIKAFGTGIIISGSSANGLITFSGTGNTGMSWPGTVPPLPPDPTTDMFFGSNGAGSFIWNDKADATGNTCMDLVANTGILKVTQKDDGAGVGPVLYLTRKSATPAANDSLGYIGFTGPNTSQTDTAYADILATDVSPADGSEEGSLLLRTMGTTRLTLNKTGAVTTGDFISNAGMFTSSTTQTFITTTGAGAIYFRPNGRDSSVGQAYIDSGGGFTTPGGINATGQIKAGGSIGGAFHSPADTILSSGNGSVYIRPSGPSVSGGSTRFNADGSINLSGGSINTTYPNMNLSVGPPGGIMYFRPNGEASTVGEVKIAVNGTVTVSGPTITVDAPYATNVNGTTLGGGLLQNSRAGTALVAHCSWANANGTVGGIYTSGTTTSYNTTSDENLKDFIGPYDPQAAIAIIRADPVREFTWKADGSHAVGWGAQTSYAVSPDLASPPPEPKEGEDPVPWGIDQGRRTPYLWAALSHALDRIDALEARIAALEGGS